MRKRELMIALLALAEKHGIYGRDLMLWEWAQDEANRYAEHKLLEPRWGHYDDDGNWVEDEEETPLDLVLGSTELFHECDCANGFSDDLHALIDECGVPDVDWERPQLVKCLIGAVLYGYEAA